VEQRSIPTHIKVERIIGSLGTKGRGPCCLFFGGVHGNEASGVIAMQAVFESLKARADIQFHGSFYFIGGNLLALEVGKRCTESDLNRLWTEKRMKAVEKGDYVAENHDAAELLSIYKTIEEILEKEEGPFYMFDLHTTSSKTIPFITVNDSLLNRKFTELYPLPLVLGIEEYLDGPMLSYYNEKGYVSFGFEGGEHYSQTAIQNHESFIYLSLVFSGVIDESGIDYDAHFQQLADQSNGMEHFYEIYHRFAIDEEDDFAMKNGFKNFQPIGKGEALATFNAEVIEADHSSIIFMPLYQSSGSDGFFLIKQTKAIFLRLSSWIRKLKLDRLLPILPGIYWYDDKHEKMMVDMKIARFLAKPFLHLMGYRARQVENDVLIIKNREASSRNEDYKHEKWF
jgi:hypothetical protein